MADLRTWHTGCSMKHWTDGESNLGRSNAEMKICLCGTDKAASTIASLEKLIGDILPKECFYSCRDIRDFEQRLRDPRRAADLAVLVPADELELDEFAALRELYDDTRILLVLGERSPGMIMKGHSLRPRFMAFADTEPGVVRSVLEKMTNSAGNGKSMEMKES